MIIIDSTKGNTDNTICYSLYNNALTKVCDIELTKEQLQKLLRRKSVQKQEYTWLLHNSNKRDCTGIYAKESKASEIINN